jgi:hypothetical protein
MHSAVPRWSALAAWGIAEHDVVVDAVAGVILAIVVVVLTCPGAFVAANAKIKVRCLCNKTEDGSATFYQMKSTIGQAICTSQIISRIASDHDNSHLMLRYPRPTHLRRG